MLADQLRLERAVPVAWHLDRDRPIVGQDRLAAVPLR
jgi:hypothetical protein